MGQKSDVGFSRGNVVIMSPDLKKFIVRILSASFRRLVCTHRAAVYSLLEGTY